MISPLFSFTLLVSTLTLTLMFEAPVLAASKTPVAPIAVDDLMGVDVADVVNISKGKDGVISYAPKAFAAVTFPEAAAILQALDTDPVKFIFGESAKDVQQRFSTVLTGSAVSVADGRVFPLATFFLTTDDRLIIRKYEFYVRKVVSTDPSQVVSYLPVGIKFLQDLDVGMSQGATPVRFTVRIGLVERKVIIEDVNNKIKLIYPIGVGGVDELDGTPRIVTPIFTHGIFEKRFAIKEKSVPQPDPAEHRKYVNYYRKMPFLPISTRPGARTHFALHIEVNGANANANLETIDFKRGFDSHGCMRLRKKDLYEFYNIVTHFELDSIPVTTAMSVPDGGNHPAPYFTKYYQHYQNCGTVEEPVSCPDPADPELTWMVPVYKPAPIEEMLNNGSNIPVTLPQASSIKDKPHAGAELP